MPLLLAVNVIGGNPQVSAAYILCQWHRQVLPSHIGLILSHSYISYGEIAWGYNIHAQQTGQYLIDSIKFST